MQRRASSRYGAGKAAVGQISRQARQLPQASGSGASAGRSSVVKIEPRNSQDPYWRETKLVCLPCQPSPALAAMAGIGWQGKHTNLVSRDWGSWLFLGEIYLGFALPPDAAERDHCGACHACLDICPTHAFPAPYQLDARRCISYLTIENKGPIPPEFRKNIGNRIYGCDDCLAVCPWNKFAQAGREVKLAAREELRTPELAELARLDDAAFRARFAKSPVKRIGRDRFIRNVLIAIGNSGEHALAAEAERLLSDTSPLVRGAAVWALAQLSTHDRFDALATEAMLVEADTSVRAEWQAAKSSS